MALSGWLFADLLLGIGLLFFVAESRGTPRTPTATPRTATPTGTLSPTVIPTQARGTPSVTPSPTGTPTATATSVKTGLNRTPYRVYLRTDPDLFLRGKSDERGNASDLFRKQIRSCFAASVNSRVGMVLATGSNPDASNGHKLAQSAINLLPLEFKSLFEGAVFKDYHNLSADDASQNGVVELEVYYLDDPLFPVPNGLLGAICNAPPETWCQGKPNDQKLIVNNWVGPSLPVKIDNTTYTIKSASDGVFRTVGCVMLAPGDHAWSVGQVGGPFHVDPNMDSKMDLCNLNGSVNLCPGGNLPTSSGPGIGPTVPPK